MAHPKSRGERIAQKQRINQKRTKYTNRRQHSADHVPAAHPARTGEPTRPRGLTPDEVAELIAYLEYDLGAAGIIDIDAPVTRTEGGAA